MINPAEKPWVRPSPNTTAKEERKDQIVRFIILRRNVAADAPLNAG